MQITCSFLNPPIALSLFGPNILRSTLLRQTLILCSLNVRDQVYVSEIQMILNCEIEDIPLIWSALNFVVNAVVIS